MPAILVLTTLPNDDSTTAELARTLIVERLAACVNVHGPMASTYRWKGRVERDAERQVVIKTTRDRLEESANIGGAPFVLIDAAGLRKTEDAVERIGVERAESALPSAFTPTGELPSLNQHQPRTSRRY